MGLISADDGVWAAVVAAQAMVNFADCWSPMTEDIAKVMGDGSGGPFALGEGADKWYSAAGKLQEAQQQLVEQTKGLPRDYWNGDDRDKFDSEISSLAAEIGDSHNYALTVAITLTGLTVPIAAWPIMCDTIGVIEAVNAASFYAALASVVGDLGASEALFAEGEAVTATCLTVVNASMGIMIALMAAGTAAIAISDIADIATQTGHGDTGIAGEFGKAAIDSSAEVAMTVAMDHMSHREGGEGSGEGEGSGSGEGEGSGSGEGEGSGEGTASAEGSGSGEGSGEGSGSGEGASHEDPLPAGLKDSAKEHAKDKVTDPVTSGLSWLINHGAGAVDPGWNSPDAPSSSDEQWGAGE